MTDTKNNTPGQTPEQPLPSGISAIHPLTQAAAALHICFHPVSAETDLDTLAAELERALIADNIDNPDEAETILAMQSRVMNTIFTRLMIQAFPQERAPDMDCMKAAFMAQRQCAHTIDKLKRHKKNSKK